MNTKKRFLSAFLALLMLLSIVPSGFFEVFATSAKSMSAGSYLLKKWPDEFGILKHQDTYSDDNGSGLDYSLDVEVYVNNERSILDMNFPQYMIHASDGNNAVSTKFSFEVNENFTFEKMTYNDTTYPTQKDGNAYVGIAQRQIMSDGFNNAGTVRIYLSTNRENAGSIGTISSVYLPGNLYDYGTYYGSSWYTNDTSALNTGLNGTNGSAIVFGSSNPSWTHVMNYYDGGANVPYWGIVNTDLSQGLFRVGAPDLFGASATSYKKVWSNVSIPFFYDSSTNRYSYDSNANGVEFNSSTNRLEMLASAESGFWPFGTKGQNCYFGMNLNVQFAMPKDGLINGTTPMTFEFSGDDDLWVYVDNQLTLDIGGIHGANGGLIDFANGLVYYQHAPYNASAHPGWANVISQNPRAGYGYAVSFEALGLSMEDYSMHTMNIYYMERGANESNNKMTFNLLTFTGNPNLFKQVTGINDAVVDADTEYQFQVLVNGAAAPGLEYKVGSEGYTTDTNGMLSLKAGETASFNVDADNQVSMREVNADQFNTSNQVQDLITQQVLKPQTDGKESGNYQIGDSNASRLLYTFTNTADTGTLQIEKAVQGDLLQADDTFAFKVWLTSEDYGKDNMLYTGDIYLNDAVTPTQLGDDGVITLHKDDTVAIKGLPVGTEYKVQELAADGYDLKQVTTAAGAQQDNTDPTIVTGTVVQSDTVYTNQFENKIHTETVTINKTDRDGNALRGATFTVTDGTGAVVALTPVAASGSAETGYASYTFEARANTSYTVRETVAPAGYEPITGSYTVQFGPDGTMVQGGAVSGFALNVASKTITVTDTEKTLDAGKVRIEKYDSYGNALAGAKFTLSGGDISGEKTLTARAHRDGETTLWSQIVDAVSGLFGVDTGTKYIYDLSSAVSVLAFGQVYRVTETAPDGYTGVGSFYITLNDNGGSLEVMQCDENGNPVTGSKIIITTVTENETIIKVPNSLQQVSDLTVAASKVWVDGNASGISRPAAVTMVLHRANSAGRDTSFEQTLPANAANNWQVQFTNLARYDLATGESWAYTVDEQSVPAGYTKAVTGSAAAGFVITNTRSDIGDNVTISAAKQWAGDDGFTTLRPASVQLALYRDGQQTVLGTVTLTAAEGWAAKTFAPVAKYDADGSPITYVVKETLPAGSGYTVTGGAVTVTGTAGSALLVNTLGGKTVTVRGAKTWQDSNNQYNTRPASITVNLLANGSQVASKTVTGTNWDYQWSNLPAADFAGNPITYAVQETAVAGYSAVYSGYDITNTLTTDGSVTAVKNWVDDGNIYGTRPNSVTLQLYADGVKVEGETLTLTASSTVPGNANQWAGSFENLPQKNSVGANIVYTVQETATPQGYTKAEAGLAVTNTLTKDKTIAVEKVWNDGNGTTATRPQSVTYKLYADNKEVAQAQGTAASGWGYTFTGLPQKNALGADINYTVTETQVAGYAAPVYAPAAGAAAGGTITVTNTVNQQTISQTVNKVWQGENGYEALSRPTQVTVELLADGQSFSPAKTAVLNSQNNWQYEFTGLAKYNSAGAQIVYAAVEKGTTPTGYTKAEAGLTVTNTLSSTVDIQASKTWVDGNDQQGLRPDQLTVQLKADNVLVASKALNAAGGWTASFTGLPKYNASGAEIAYTVTEAAVPDGYTATTAVGTKANGYMLVNTISQDNNVNANGQKAWSGDDAVVSLVRPQTVTLELLADGAALSPAHTTTASAAGNWQYSFTGLAKYNAAGAAIQYTVREVQGAWAANYTSQNGTAQNSYTVTNTYNGGTKEQQLTKVWVDGNNGDNTRPAGVTFTLHAKVDGTQLWSKDYSFGVTGTATSWGYTTEKLPAKTAEGKTISYTATETVVPSGYTKVSEQGLTVTNQLQDGNTSLTVEKVWSGDDAVKDITRPASIQLQLKKNNTNEGSPITLASAPDGSWQYTFTGLPMYTDGVKNTYTVEEVAGDWQTNYTSSQQTAGTTVTLTNTYTGNETITLTKAWVDGSNADNTRPAQLNLVLNATVNGVATQVGTYVLNSSMATAGGNSWQGTVSGLPAKAADGSAITWTATEPNVPTGYTKASEQGLTVTNQLTDGSTSLTVEKVWSGDDTVKDLTRPADVTVQLKQNGSNLGEAVNLTAANNWQYEFTNLPVYTGGVKNTYTVEEAAGNWQANYSSSQQTSGTTVTITNTYNGGSDLTLVKNWVDNSNADSTRPDAVVLTLNAMVGSSSVWSKDYTLSGSATTNSWQQVATGMPAKAADGSTITWAATEKDVPAGYTKTSEQGLTVTNQLLDGGTSLTVEKVWSGDDAVKDLTRPASIQLQLKKNNVNVGSPVTLTPDAQGKWAHTFDNLSVYENGVRNTYTVEEVAGDWQANYTSSQQAANSANGTAVTITNTYNGGSDLTLTKNWVDNSNADNTRPGELDLTLSAVVGSSTVWSKVYTVTGAATANSWQQVVKGLPAQTANGSTIAWAATEPNVPAGYTKTSEQGLAVTNQLLDGTTSLAVQKAWSGDDLVKGLTRPASIEVQLKQNGSNLGTPVALTADGGWQYEFTALPTYTGGVKNVYTVQEVAGSWQANYTSSQQATSGTAVTITNTYSGGSGLTLIKNWVDDNNATGGRPGSLTLTLNYTVGETTARQADYTLDATMAAPDGSWQKTVSGMPSQTADGSAITWSVSEEDANVPQGYTKTQQSGLSVTNTIQQYPVVIQYHVYDETGAEKTFTTPLQDVSLGTLPYNTPLSSLESAAQARKDEYYGLAGKVDVDQYQRGVVRAVTGNASSDPAQNVIHVDYMPQSLVTKYTVTYSNGLEGSDAVTYSGGSREAGTNYTVFGNSVTGFTNGNKTFAGWQQVTQYAVGAGVGSTQPQPEGNVIYQAVWQGASCSITYHANYQDITLPDAEDVLDNNGGDGYQEASAFTTYTVGDGKDITTFAKPG
ncbi:MAG: Cna B-type domain-containing protein [Pygmaiobacter sp.]|nr:Cna B-type domain-containing protein [Pygmaiobacter sp.]